MRSTMRFGVVLLLFGLCAQCLAAVPGMLSYQGKVTGADGQPASDGSYAMVFSLYGQEAGGTALWAETRSVPLSGGVFSVLLGSVTPIPETAFQGTTWLETSVNGTVLAPRAQIVSAGYAILAKKAETVPDGSITGPKIGIGAVGTAQLQDASVQSSDLANSSVTSSKLAVASVGSAQLQDASIQNSDLANGSVTSAKIAAGNVTVDKLAADAKLLINVKTYGAVGDGVTDDTASFQNALNAASAAGGGIVWVPIGNYKIATHLNLPAFVTLAGVFQNPPGRHFGGPYGSALLAYEGQGSETGTPFISMNEHSTIRGLCIVYPEQNRTAPVPYPWCVRGNGDNCSIIDTMIYNAWNAVDFGTNVCSRHNIRGLCGQPLHTGIWVDQCYDVGRIQDIHLYPFWEQGLISYMQQNATAVKFGRTDWEYVTNCFVLGYKIGYHFVRTANGNCNGTFVSIGADASDIAVRVDSASPIGLLISNGQFVGDYSSTAVGMYVGADGGGVSLTNCSFWGASNRIATVEGGSVKLDSCNFADWDKNGAGEYAVTATGGRLTVQGCTFMHDKNRVRVQSGVTAAIVIGNQGMNNTDVSNSIGTKCSTSSNQR